MAAGPHLGSNTQIYNLPPTGWLHKGADAEEHLDHVATQTERTNIHKAEKVSYVQGQVPLLLMRRVQAEESLGISLVDDRLTPCYVLLRRH